MNQALTHTFSRRRGFTLIEAMISLAILGAIVIVFASSVVMAEKSAHVNGQYAQALSLCQHKIDQMRAVGFGRLTYTELNDAGMVDDEPVSSPYSFTVVDQVSDYLPQPTAALTITSVTSKTSRVVATVTWRPVAHNTKTSTVSLTGLIANVE